MAMNQLTMSGTTLELPNSLLWVDQFAWSPAVQAKEYSLTGALIVDGATRLAGRPITLRSPDEESGWFTQEQLDQLYAWSSVPLLTGTLTLDGVSFDVMFDRESAPLEAAYVLYLTSGQYTATVRLMEV